MKKSGIALLLGLALAAAAFQGFAESGGTGQRFRIQAGHPANAGMNTQVMGRSDGNGNGISGIQVGVEFHGSDLDHFKDQFVTHLTIGAALVRDGLVPFEIKNDVGHKNVSTQFIIHN